MTDPRRRSPFVEYFVNLWTGIVTTWLGMKLTMRYCRAPKVTMRYPEEKPEVLQGYRGIHGFAEDKCLVCKACAAACPVDAIIIEALGKGRDRLITRFDIDYGKCLFCDLCTPPCPDDAIWMSPQYDLSGRTREDCLVQFARTKTPDEIAAHLKMLEQKEAEKKAKAAAAAEAKKAAEAKAKEEKPKDEKPKDA